MLNILSTIVSTVLKIILYEPYFILMIIFADPARDLVVVVINRAFNCFKGEMK